MIVMGGTPIFGNTHIYLLDLVWFRFQESNNPTVAPSCWSKCSSQSDGPLSSVVGHVGLMGFQARLCGSVRYTSQALDVEVKTARSKGKQWKTMENDPTTYVFGVSQTGGFSFSINQPLGWIWTQPFQEKKSFETFSSWCKEKLGPVLHVFQGPEQEVHVFFVQNICIRIILNNHDSFDLCWVRDPWFAEVCHKPTSKALGSDCWAKFWSESALDRRNRRVVWRDLDFTWIDS